MNSDNKISVIIPIYNVEKYIDRCIKSVVNQSYKNLEIILINDGSLDRSGDICDKWAKKDKRIKVIHQKNSGVSVARNIGLDNAKGEYITFVDADDYIELDYCEVLQYELNKNSVDIIYCNIFTNKHIDTNKTIKWSSKEYDPVFKMTHCFVWGALYKKEILQGIQFDKDLFVAEDSYFFIQAVKKSAYIAHVDKALYHYIYYPNSAFHGKFTLKKYTELESWNRICSLFEADKKIQKRCKAALAKRCKIMVIRFARDSNFTKEYRVKCIKEYRKNAKYLIIHMIKNKKYKSLVKEILYFLFPNLWIMCFIKVKGNIN